jgi:hypothetical protein
MGMGGMPGGMGGMPGGMGRSGGDGLPALDPLASANDSSKPLIQKLLAVPSFRTKYLGYIKAISEKWLDWKRVGPLVEQYKTLISADVKADTRKLDSYEAFTSGIDGESLQSASRGPGAEMSIKKFVEGRKTYLTTNSVMIKELK